MANLRAYIKPLGAQEVSRLHARELRVVAQTYDGDIAIDVTHHDGVARCWITVRPHSGGPERCLFTGRVDHLLELGKREGFDIEMLHATASLMARDKIPLPER